MCTVTFLPIEGGRFILTSNRDESPKRAVQDLSNGQRNGGELLFPKDPLAGGTWIAASDDRRVACVLNGAFEKHAHLPAYRRSRGLLLLDYFDVPAAEYFSRKYSFDGIEPFTMIAVETASLVELRWDGQEVYVNPRPLDGKYIWSSTTLYLPDAQRSRQQWFDDWLRKTRHFDLNSIRDFHRNGGEADTQNGFVMNRNGIVQTVSMTSVIDQGDGFEIVHEDLLSGSLTAGFLPFGNPAPTTGAAR